MEHLNITFLGTGNAVPTALRNHTAILIDIANEHLLIDCGEGTQRQYKIAGISPSKLTKLFITHWHGDHVLGIPGLFQTLAMADYQRTLEIYGPNGTVRNIALTQELYKDFKIATKIREGAGMCFENTSLRIEAKSMHHGTPTNAYAIILKERLRLDKTKIKKLKLPNSPLLGELQRGKDIVWQGKKIKAKSITYREPRKKIVIILDTGMNSEAIELARDADLLICESTFSHEEQEKAQEYKHLTAHDAATIAKKAKVKQLILTHISQRYEHAPHIIEKEAKKIFKNTKIVKDFDAIIV